MIYVQVVKHSSVEQMQWSGSMYTPRTNVPTSVGTLAYTISVASIAPNFLAKEAAELGHTGDVHASFTWKAEGLGAGTHNA